jgi:flagellar hook assembly protein FlgD
LDNPPRLSNEQSPAAGKRNVTGDGSDEAGQAVPPGVCPGLVDAASGSIFSVFIAAMVLARPATRPRLDNPPRLSNEQSPAAGKRNVTGDGSDEAGQAVPPGVCPGLVDAASGSIFAVVFIAAMALGALVAERVRSALGREANPAPVVHPPAPSAYG